MARKIRVSPHHAKERIAYGIFISALGCLWLAAETGLIQTSVPIGPVIIIILGFTMFLPWLKDS
ncbi:MAG: hypothetical protein N3E51_04815 [Candidatus Micrarchaeota archaeon]|nr:hypothetical protein [Candidatus Micrarchaeota archaeon]